MDADRFPTFGCTDSETRAVTGRVLRELLAIGNELAEVNSRFAEFERQFASSTRKQPRTSDRVSLRFEDYLPKAGHKRSSDEQGGASDVE